MTLLYILKFKEEEVIKIGITTSLISRIKRMTNDSGLTVDYFQSHIVTSDKNSQIRRLEDNLLNITTGFEYHFSRDFTFNGYLEFRKSNCLNLIFQFIEEQNDYGIKFRIYHGIDVCENYSHTIPKAYYPINESCPGPSKLLIEDILNYCTQNNIDPVDVVNEILFEKAKEYGIARSDKPIFNYIRFYKLKG